MIWNFLTQVSTVCRIPVSNPIPYSFADVGHILVVAAAVRDRQAVRHSLTKMLDMHYLVINS